MEVTKELRDSLKETLKSIYSCDTPDFKIYFKSGRIVRGNIEDYPNLDPINFLNLVAGCQGEEDIDDHVDRLEDERFIQSLAREGR